MNELPGIFRVLGDGRMTRSVKMGVAWWRTPSSKECKDLVVPDARPFMGLGVQGTGSSLRP